LRNVRKALIKYNIVVISFWFHGLAKHDTHDNLMLLFGGDQNVHFEYDIYIHGTIV